MRSPVRFSVTGGRPSGSTVLPPTGSSTSGRPSGGGPRSHRSTATSTRGVRVATGAFLLAALLLAGLLTPSPARAQGAPPPPDTLDLPWAGAAAEATHPSVAAAEAALRAGAAEADRARAERWPSLTAAGSLVRFQEPMVVAPLHGFDPTDPPDFDRALVRGGLAAELVVFDGGERGARIEQAAAAAAGARVDAEATRAELRERVVGAWVDLWVAREALAGQRTRLEALEAEAGRAGRFLREGRSPRVAVLRAEAARSGARAELAAGEARLTAAERALARLTGVPVAAVADRPLRPPPHPSAGVPTASLEPSAANPPASLEPSAAATPPHLEPGAAAAPTDPELLPGEPSPRPAHTVERRWSWHSGDGEAAEVRLARTRVEEAEAALTGARAARVPDLALAAGYDLFGSAAGALTGEWQTGVRVAYPLFTGGARAAAIEAADARLRGARATLATVELHVADALDGARVALAEAAARHAALEDAVAQLEEVARIEALALENGAGTQTDYLDAEAALAESRARLAEARGAALRARAALARLEGRLDATWLARSTEVDP